MTENKKETRESQTAFDVSSCMAVMEKMMAQHGEGCNCAEMMSQVTTQDGIPEEWMKVMSQMMGFHSGKVEEGEESQQA